jgi:hypothetical protein
MVLVLDFLDGLLHLILANNFRSLTPVLFEQRLIERE